MGSISVVIPAHNEASYLGGCLDAVDRAGALIDASVETVVVLNRCTDGTRDIAIAHGATCIDDNSRNLARIRNRGVAVAGGDVIVTCDADSRLHPRMLLECLRALDNGAVGGGVPVKHDRRSLGIATTELILRAGMLVTRVGAGAFWTRKDDFEAVGGFDESRPMGEDVAFAQRLRAHGRRTGRPFVVLRAVPLTTSSRKFDRFGDWAFLRMATVEAPRIRRSLRGEDTEFVDRYFYDFNDTEA